MCLALGTSPLDSGTSYLAWSSKLKFESSAVRSLTLSVESSKSSRMAQSPPE